jgi:hypothetical protein
MSSPNSEPAQAAAILNNRGGRGAPDSSREVNNDGPATTEKEATTPDFVGIQRNDTFSYDNGNISDVRLSVSTDKAELLYDAQSATREAKAKLEEAEEKQRLLQQEKEMSDMDPSQNPPADYEEETETSNKDDTEELHTNVPVETIADDECDKAFERPPDPMEVLLDQLQPLNKTPPHRDAYASLATAHNQSYIDIEDMSETMKKINKPDFMPSSLTLHRLVLEESTPDTKDDPTFKRLSDEFNTLKERFKQEAKLLIKKGIEQEITIQREKIGKLLLQDMRSIAIQSATRRILYWNAYNSDKQCEKSPAILGNLAVELLLEPSPCSKKLETWLNIPSLSALYKQLPFSSEDPSDVIPGNPVKYANLDKYTGDRKQVNLLVQELEKYIPMCTIEHSRSAQLVRHYKAQEGALSARRVLKDSRKATAACEHAMNNGEEAAAIAQFKAQQASPNPNPSAPKGLGGRSRNPSTPPPKNAKNKSGKGNQGRAKEAPRNAIQNANESLQKHSPLRAKRRAKSQDSESDDDTPPPKKKRQRGPGPKHPIPPATAKAKPKESSKDQNRSKTTFQKRRRDRGGANRQNKRNKDPS